MRYNGKITQPFEKINGARSWTDGSAVKCNALAEDTSLLPSTHIRQVTNAYNSSFWRSDTLFLSPQAPEFTWYTHTSK